MGLQHCRFTESHDAYTPTDFFIVFNGAFRVDPQGISPFIPYIIRSDLGRILGDAYNDVENDLGDSGTLDDIASPRDAPINIASGPGDPPAMSTRGDEHLKWPAITVGVVTIIVFPVYSDYIPHLGSGQQ